MASEISPRQGINIGDLVVDNYHRVGIVVALEVDQPHPGWLAAQQDEAMRDPGHKTWWTVACMTGGAISAPDRLLRRVGPATEKDRRVAMAHANAHGRKILQDLPLPPNCESATLPGD